MAHLLTPSSRYRRSLRLHATALLRVGGMKALYRRLPVCARAIQYQLSRNRISEAVQAALIEELGADGWRFVCGAVDTLTDQGGDDGAA